MMFNAHLFQTPPIPTPFSIFTTLMLKYSLEFFNLYFNSDLDIWIPPNLLSENLILNKLHTMNNFENGLNCNVFVYTSNPNYGIMYLDGACSPVKKTVQLLNKLALFGKNRDDF